MEVLNKVLKFLKVPGFREKDNEYKNNPEYRIRRSLFEVYKPVNVKIAMLGDSITQGADWNELLGRTDIINRGISGDITQGFLNRLQDIYRLCPKYCLIMGGINDFGQNKSVDEVYANYELAVKRISAKKIKPVIQSTLSVSSDFENSAVINEKVEKLNVKLRALAETYKTKFIDVNSVLSEKNALLPAYTHDGLHLLGNGYAKWAELIKKDFLNASDLD